MLDKFEEAVLDPVKQGVVSALAGLHEHYTSAVKPEGGMYGDAKAVWQKLTGWSDEILDSIRSQEEFDIYRKANLKEIDVGGRTALIRSNIDINTVDDFGRTNAQRMAEGYSPIDSQGEVIELHHIGQKANSPLAELTMQEHRGRGNDTILHDKTQPTEVYTENNNWTAQRQNHWRSREIQSPLANTIRAAHDAGIKSGLAAATLSAAVSTVDNIGKVINGEITPQEAFVDVAKDTGIAGAVGYGTTFVSTTVATAMRASSHELIRSLGTLGNGCMPAAVISFGVASFDSVVDFAKGEIDGKQLALELGESAAAVGGGIAGGALLTAGVVAVAGVTTLPAVAGVAVGLVGGMVGCALASQAYATAVEHAPEIAEALKVKAQEAANSVADLVTNTIPDKLEDMKSAINNFAATNKLPIHL